MSKLATPLGENVNNFVDSIFTKALLNTIYINDRISFTNLVYNKAVKFIEGGFVCLWKSQNRHGPKQQRSAEAGSRSKEGPNYSFIVKFSFISIVLPSRSTEKEAFRIKVQTSLQCSACSLHTATGRCTALFSSQFEWGWLWHLPAGTAETAGTVGGELEGEILHL